MSRRKSDFGTPVMFRYFNYEVVALFPTMPGSHKARHVTAYTHVGQHFAVDIAFVMATSSAVSLDERQPLWDELVGQGYDDLVLYHRFSKSLQEQLLARLAQGDA